MKNEKNTSKKHAWIIPIGLMALLVIIVFLFSLTIGRYHLSLADIVRVITNHSPEEMKKNVFFTLRLPRSIMVVLAGFGLGLVGSVYQIIFKNPLASPDLMGVSSGANVGAAIGIVVMGYSTAFMIGASFVGGLLVSFMAIALVQVTGKNKTLQYILAGIVMKSLSESVIMVLKTLADPEKELAAMDYWSMGSFKQITLTKLMTILPTYCIGMLGIVLLRRQVSLLALEEGEGKMLGIDMGRMRMVILFFSTLLVASIVSVTGLISFIGLIAPQIGWLILKEMRFRFCVFSGLVGAFILLIADSLSKVLYSAEFPISIFTSLIGVPFLLYPMLKRKKGVM